MFIGASYTHLFFTDKPSQEVSSIHKPWFLAFTNNKNLCKGGAISRVSEPETWTSFHNTDKKIQCVRCYTSHPKEISDAAHGLWKTKKINSAQTDMKYLERILIDLAVDKDIWLMDTKGKTEKIKVLVYDIEFFQNRIAIIGYSSFSTTIKSSKKLDSEEFDIDILDMPKWEDVPVTQLIAKSDREEALILEKFLNLIKSHHIIAGHNILQYDNVQVFNRVKYFVENKSYLRNVQTFQLFQEFLTKYAYQSNIHNFGKKQDVVYIMPTSFDTYFAATKCFRYLEVADFTLKKLAPALGIKIKNRVHMNYQQLAYDQRTYAYNKHDVQEEVGLTILLLQQAIPLAFTSGFLFEHFFPSGNIRIGDFMSAIRAQKLRKIFPPVIHPEKVASSLIYMFPGKNVLTRKEIEDEVRKRGDDAPSMLQKMARYGHEMPEFVLYPRLIVGFTSAGGRALMPQELKSEQVPWFRVVAADVAGMFPNIQIQRNLSPDTTRLCLKGEKPDEYIWLKRMPPEYVEIFETRVDKGFASEGYLVGIKIRKDTAVMVRVMSSLMKAVGRVRKLKKESEGPQQQMYQQMYDSLKALRNANSWGILLSPTVMCRQFNLGAGSMIATKGSEILYDLQRTLKKKGARLLYGDTDSLYIATSNSASTSFCSSLGMKPSFLDGPAPKVKNPYISRKRIYRIIKMLQKRWNKRLEGGFELETEDFECLVIISHKNYLYFTIGRDGQPIIKLKGATMDSSDKPPVCMSAMRRIITASIKENLSWTSETEGAQKLMSTIQKHTSVEVQNLKPDKVEDKELIMIQSMRAPEAYKTGTAHYERAKAVEGLLGKKIEGGIKLEFLVCVRTLPGLRAERRKSAAKPLAYMFPRDFVKDRNQIDFSWYSLCVNSYICTAFKLNKEVMAKGAGSMRLEDFMGIGV